MNNPGMQILALIFFLAAVMTGSAYFYVFKFVRRRKTSEFPIKVQSDGVFPTSSSIIGAVQLEKFARNHEPQYIVGINRGGWLISNFLAHRLDIDRDKIFRFDSGRKDFLDKNEIKIKNSNVLLIDDISRTGESITVAFDHIRKICPDCKIKVSVLVICADNGAKEIIDFYPYETDLIDIQLPWSPEERKKEARDRLAEQGESHVLNLDEEDIDIEKSPQVLRMPIVNEEDLSMAGHDSDSYKELGIDMAIHDIETLIKAVTDPQTDKVA